MKSEEDKLLDDLLREKLGSYHEQPPTGVWQGIAQKLPYRPFGKFFPGSDGGLLITLIGSIVVLSGLVYFFAGNLDTRASKEKTAHHAVTKNLNTEQLISTNDSRHGVELASTGQVRRQAGLHDGISENRPGNTPSTPVEVNQSTASKSQVKGSAEIIQPQATRKARPGKAGTAGVTATQDKTRPAKSASNESISLTSNDLFTGSAQAMAAMTSLKPKSSPLLADKSNTYYIQSLRNQYPTENFRLNPRRKGPYYQARGTYYASAFYRPEFLKNPSEEAFADERYAAGLSFRYTRNLLLLETGLEYNHETRNQSYNVQYYDFLGTYNNLDSIAFAQQGPQVVPTYFYTTDSVYQSGLTTSVFSNKASYGFLKIPLLIGMEKTLGAFSIGIKGGLMFGVLLNSSGTAFDNQDPESKIDNYNSATPTYLGTNIQWVLKADIDWHIRPNFGLTLGPMINEYLTDPYEGARGTVDSPVYWGIQGGVFYKW